MLSIYLSGQYPFILGAVKVVNIVLFMLLLLLGWKITRRNYEIAINPKKHFDTYFLPECERDTSVPWILHALKQRFNTYSQYILDKISNCDSYLSNSINILDTTTKCYLPDSTNEIKHLIKKLDNNNDTAKDLQKIVEKLQTHEEDLDYIVHEYKSQIKEFNMYLNELKESYVDNYEEINKQLAISIKVFDITYTLDFIFTLGMFLMVSVIDILLPSEEVIKAMLN